MSLSERTYFPPAEEGELSKVESFLAVYKDRHGTEARPQFFLSGSNEGEQILLPKELYEILVRTVEALASGKAVTIHPNDPLVTTQQAAELLGVSRPTVVKLIEDGKLEATKVTRHRRIKLEDVLRYQERQTIEQLDFLASTTSDAPALTESEYVSVRKMLANKRRESRIG